MKMKKFFIVCFATLGIIVIVYIVNIGSDQLPITENNVRTQLEQMYDAEVAEVKKNEDVYEAIIAKEWTSVFGRNECLDWPCEFIGTYR